jgi:hypothetical protein
LGSFSGPISLKNPRPLFLPDTKVYNLHLEGLGNQAFSYSGVLVPDKNGLPAPTTGQGPLQSPVPSGTFAPSPVGNISGEVTMQDLLANNQLIPGMQGAYLKVRPGDVIRFVDLSQLTINHNGAEFMLSREVVRNANQVTRRWRIYSGTPDKIPPPMFFEPNGPGGIVRIERIVGHTHARSIPFDPIFMQPSRADLDYLRGIAGSWRQVYGPQSEPFGRIIWGLTLEKRRCMEPALRQVMLSHPLG